MKLELGIVFVAAMAGCGGHAIDGGDTGSAPLTAAKMRCADSTHGPIDPYTTPATLTSRLARKWYSCSANDGTPSIFHHDGIEFHEDGTFNLLARDASGQMVPQLGVENQGTWDVFAAQGTFHPPSDTTPGDYPYVYVHLGSADDPTEMAFETTPTRLHTTEATSGWTTWLVPFDP